MARHSIWTRANTRMGWSDPVFGSLWLPKRIVGSLQPRKQGGALFAKGLPASSEGKVDKMKKHALIKH